MGDVASFGNIHSTLCSRFKKLIEKLWMEKFLRVDWFFLLVPVKIFADGCG